MKRVFVTSLLAAVVFASGLVGRPVVAADPPAPSRAGVSIDKPDVCKLHGKVKFVDSFPDYKIKVVTSFPDLKVKKVTSFPDDSGEWMIVDSFPDFTVQVVDSFPDFTIEYVDSFPGCS